MKEVKNHFFSRAFTHYNDYICNKKSHCEARSVFKTSLFSLFIIVNLLSLSLLSANSKTLRIKEVYVVHDKVLLNDFATRHNVALLLAIRLDKSAQDIHTLSPKVIQKDNMLYITFPGVVNHSPHKFETTLGQLELNARPNHEVYLALKSDAYYDIKTEIHGSMLYVIFAGIHSLSEDLLSHKTTIIPASHHSESQTVIAQNVTKENQKNSQIQPTSDDNYTQNKQEPLQDSLTDNYEISSWRYFAVLAIMIILILVLYLIKLRQNKGIGTSNIAIKHVKIIDSKNKILVVHLDNMQYILGVNPHGITFIDKIPQSQPEMHAEHQNKKETTTQEHAQALNFNNLLLKD
ncbi:hypothetical protein CQA66_01305 [Helicobacter aurati]|uniref:Flagellar protein n=1 Tax=Helicobacter aurati TaxID=137778 RepID=A0A3D8J8Z9_9HELI|nr:flagellar biosynthetic protein FliO [Helicobacter aurati]RDU73334.1 hypothetical protein CQA66_01305 [Helicobacter aurati]